MAKTSTLRRFVGWRPDENQPLSYKPRRELRRRKKRERQARKRNR